MIGEGGITVTEAEPSDAGIYICMAQNNAGTALGQVRLEVQGKCKTGSAGIR